MNLTPNSAPALLPLHRTNLFARMRPAFPRFSRDFPQLQWAQSLRFVPGYKHWRRLMQPFIQGSRGFALSEQCCTCKHLHRLRIWMWAGWDEYSIKVLKGAMRPGKSSSSHWTFLWQVSKLGNLSRSICITLQCCQNNREMGELLLASSLRGITALGPAFTAKGIKFGLVERENLVQSSGWNKQFLNRPPKSPKLNKAEETDQCFSA